MSEQIRMRHEKGVIYTLSDPVTDWVCYVGQTCQSPHKRFMQHIDEAQSSKEEVVFPITKNRTNWLKYLLTRGREPTLTLVEQYPKSDLDRWEGIWVARFLSQNQPLTNRSYPYSTWTELNSLGLRQIAYNSRISCPYSLVFLEKGEPWQSLSAIRRLHEEILPCPLTPLDLLNRTWGKASEQERAAFLAFINREGQHAA